MIDRLPRTAGQGMSLKRQLTDILIEHEQHIDKHAEDLPEVRQSKCIPTNASTRA